ncbi:MFS transporter, partial [Patescibacteria group bacterium]
IFAFARIIQGLGEALHSGTMESLLYDTLKEKKKEHHYDKVIANVETLTWIGLFSSSIIGGFMYDYWYRLPFIAAATLYLIMGFVTLFLEEPKIDSDKFSFTTYIKQNSKGFSQLFKDKKRSLFSLMIITIASGYFIAAKILGISQAREYGMGGKEVGILFGTGYIVAAVASYFYPKIRNKFGNAKLLIAASTILIISFVFAKFVGVVIGSLLIIMRISSSTTFNNARSVIINRLVDSRNRNTSLSTLTLLSQLPFTILFYFIGDLIDKHSPNNFALMLGLVLVILIIPQYLLFIKITTKSKQ